MIGRKGKQKEQKKENTRRKGKYRIAIVVICALAAAGGLTAALLWRMGAFGETKTYEETAAVTAPLTAGFTEEGSVSVGTVEQTFTLDLSRLLSDSDSGESGSSAETSQGTAGLSGGQQDTGGAVQQALWPGGLLNFNSVTQQDDGRLLTVEAVYVSAGETVEEGTAILKFTEDSVERIREELKEEEQNAQILYEKQQASCQRTRQEAQSQLELDQLYGTYAPGAYTAQVGALQESVETALEEQEALEKTLAEEEEELTALQEQLTVQEEVLTNAVYVVENSSREESLYWWLVALTGKTQAEETVESLRLQIDTLKNTIEENRTLKEAAVRDVYQYREELESGTAEAEATKQIRAVSAENAQEVYAVTMELAELELKTAQETYRKAADRFSEFDGYIKENKVYASQAGVVTEVGVEAGDTAGREGDLLIGLNSFEDITVTVTVQEADMEAAQPGARVNLSFSAFPEETFTGGVVQIQDAQIDSSTNTVTYQVLVSVDGGGSRFYEGMSAEVTFLTQETEEVLCVPRQAVMEKGGKSWVLVRKTDGGIEKRQVSVGRQDGVSVEIREGLQEGEIVLTES